MTRRRGDYHGASTIISHGRFATYDPAESSKSEKYQEKRRFRKAFRRLQQQQYVEQYVKPLQEWSKGYGTSILQMEFQKIEAPQLGIRGGRLMSKGYRRDCEEWNTAIDKKQACMLPSEQTLLRMKRR